MMRLNEVMRRVRKGISKIVLHGDNERKIDLAINKRNKTLIECYDEEKVR